MLDDSHFEKLWHDHSRALIAYCTYSTGSKADGEEIAAEVFVQLLKSARPVSTDRVEAWMFTVARNLCANYHRARARRRRLLERLDKTEAASPSDEVWIDAELWSTIRKLHERARMIVYLRVFEERPFVEISEIVGLSNSATKMAYYRAMDRIRAMLADVDATSANSGIGGLENAD